MAAVPKRVTLQYQSKSLIDEGRSEVLKTGEVAEWPKAAVLKTVEPCGSVGSNPTLSAN